MRRREFIAGLGSAVAWPVAARAQQVDRVRRIGVLTANAETDPVFQAQFAAFREEFRKRGCVDGRNVRIHHRWGGGDGSRMQPLAAELLAMTPDVTLACGTPAAVALQQMTGTMPVVFAGLPDPLANRLVKSLTHPGGNITGFAQYDQSLAAKLLALLKQIAPRVTHVAFLYDPANRNWSGYLAELPGGGSINGDAGFTSAFARSRRYRAHHRCIRARAQRWPDCKG
jgi:putative tryptophan/tyrosine transport system substrate-binding protein